MSSTPILGGGQPAKDLIKDATIETFEADVLEASMQVPVVVDFWASWCGPCKTLGPILEKAVTALGGKVRMVKVDTDKNQMLAQQLRIQSLPTVMAFIGGQPVDGFMGAIPESEVKGFLDRIVEAAGQMGLGGSSAKAGLKDLLAAANRALDNGNLPNAIASFAQAADIADAGSDEQAEAIAGVARTQLANGDVNAARATLAQVPAEKAGHPSVTQAAAQIDLASQSARSSEMQALEEAAAADPANLDAAMALAEAQIGAGQTDRAMETLLDMIARDRDWNEGAARQKLLTVFDALGAGHPEVKKARRRLSSLLFS